MYLPETRTGLDFAEARAAQELWANRPLAARLQVLTKARRALAASCGLLADTVSAELHRTLADTLVAEVLPLLAACRFLERHAAGILKRRKLGASRRPFWLSGVETSVERVPFGVILIIAPSNYPILLAGVQALQALAAGNAVIWKPGRGGFSPARLFADTLYRAGLPQALLQVTDESVEAAQAAIESGPDKIIFTGSSTVGRKVLRAAAETATPAVVELSGADAVFVLPGFEPQRLVDALAFGMRLNGSATCMAPRRLILIGSGYERLIEELEARFSTMAAIVLPPSVREELLPLLRSAARSGAVVRGDVTAPEIKPIKPILVTNARPEMKLAQADLFAPVLTVLTAADAEEAIALDRVCPFGLTASIFGAPREAERLAARLNRVGTCMINDLIVPTADPRVSFGGRRGSGFGSTRGAEGLLEMTAVKTTAVRRGRDRRHYEATGAPHEVLFTSIIELSHGGRGRLQAIGRMLPALRTLGAQARTRNLETGKFEEKQ